MNSNEALQIHIEKHFGPSGVEKGCEESCKKLKELVAIEINKSLTKTLEKEIKDMKKQVGKADKKALGENEKVKSISKELEETKDMVSSGIRKKKRAKTAENRGT